MVLRDPIRKRGGAIRPWGGCRRGEAAFSYDFETSAKPSPVGAGPLTGPIGSVPSKIPCCPAGAGGWVLQRPRMGIITRGERTGR